MGIIDHSTPSVFPAHLPPGKSLTFAELCRREPRLDALRYEIARLPRRRNDFCANAAWFGRGGYKARMTGIIGMLAVQFDPDLRTAEAYDLAYNGLYSLLPACQHDSYCRWSSR